MLDARGIQGYEQTDRSVLVETIGRYGQDMIYIYYIHPELCFVPYHFRSGKGARPLYSGT